MVFHLDHVVKVLAVSLLEFFATFFNVREFVEDLVQIESAILSPEVSKATILSSHYLDRPIFQTTRRFLSWKITYFTFLFHADEEVLLSLLLRLISLGHLITMVLEIWGHVFWPFNLIWVKSPSLGGFERVLPRLLKLLLVLCLIIFTRTIKRAQVFLFFN